MKHAMTSQTNLNADTDKARSFNRDCKKERNKKSKGAISKNSQKKENRPTDGGILIPALHLGREVPIGSEIKRNDVSRCDQVLRDR
jgi:hypothetical protein